MRNQSIIELLETRQLLAANLVADLTGIYPTDAVDVNGTAFFIADDDAHGREIWCSDGTAEGTHLVKDIVAGAGSPEIAAMFAVGDRLLFLKDEPGNQRSLWTSDGTTAGTRKLMDAGSDAGGYIPAAAVNGQLLFVVNSGDEGARSSALWKSDGTGAGTVKVKNFARQTEDRWFVRVFATGGGRVVLCSARELWSSDGTSGGTVELTHVAGLVTQGQGGAFESLTAVGELLYFDHTTDGEIWRTDGTPQGTIHVFTYQGAGSIDSWHAVGDRLFFMQHVHDNNEWTHTLWTSDGTELGTIALSEINSLSEIAGVNPSDPSAPAIFVNEIPGGDFEVWSTNGTSQGTTMLDSFEYAGELCALGGFVFFVASDDVHGMQVWRTDGTIDGTVMIENSVPAGAVLASLEAVDGKLAITAADTTLVLDPSTMSTPVGPQQAYFSLRDGVLRIFGTQDSDNIRIYRSQEDATRFVVKLNGVKRSFSMSQVSRIHIYGFSGDDNIAVNEKLGRISIRARIWGGGGDDLIYTGCARDTVFGEAGDDMLNPGRNADVAMGGIGDDWIYGGLGEDTVSGEGGADTVNGAGGADLVSGGNDQSDDQLHGGGGLDVIFGHAVYEIFYAGQQGEHSAGLDEVLLM